MSERIEQELRELRAPDEQEAGRRALALTRAALREREPTPRRRMPRDPRPALAAVIAALIAALILTPAGASVRYWIDEALTGEPDRAAVPLRLPAEGSILTVNSEGAWVASEDGARRRLGPYREAAFSPQGINFAVAAGRELAAVDAEGDLQWQRTAPARIADPTWAPSGLRIAYRAGDELRIVEGNGANDALYESGVAAIAPAWRPYVEGELERDVLAWVDEGGEMRIADVVSGAESITVRTNGPPRRLEWLADGRLAVATDRELAIYSLEGERSATFRQPPGATVSHLSADPDDERLALARSARGRNEARSELVLIRVEPGEERERVLFSGPGSIEGVAFAPDGSWVAFGWPPADSWLFARPEENSKLIRGIEAAPDISGRFSGGSGGGSASLLGPGFPAILDWCC